MPHLSNDITRAAFVVYRTNPGYPSRPHYRFFLHPINPAPEFAIQNGELNFQITSPTIVDSYGSCRFEARITNYFNVKGMIASHYSQLMQNAALRHLDLGKIKKTLVIDIAKDYFDRCTQIEIVPYKTENTNQPFFPKVDDQAHLFGYVEAQALPPIYAQFINTKVIALSTMEAIAFHQEKKITPNVLVNPEKTSDHSLLLSCYGNEGQDLLLSEKTPGASVGFQREIKGLRDWYSHENNINRFSFLKLTQGLNDQQPNASKIAKLFHDYAKKGSGLQALLHGHLFRHRQNIAKAKEMVKVLNAEFKTRNNEEIAIYLVQQYQELDKKFPVNPRGSFARRINYSILQLTNGLCHTVADFLAYQAQNNRPAFREK